MLILIKKFFYFTSAVIEPNPLFVLRVIRKVVVFPEALVKARVPICSVVTSNPPTHHELICCHVEGYATYKNSPLPSVAEYDPFVFVLKRFEARFNMNELS